LPLGWRHASELERHEILRDMFEAIYVDTNTKQLVGVKPFAEFVPLFTQTTMVEMAGVFVKEKDPYTESLIQTLGVSGGSDGIRIVARREGFRPRLNDLIRVAPMPDRLAEPQSTYLVHSDIGATPVLRKSPSELSIVHWPLLATATRRTPSLLVVNGLHHTFLRCLSASWGWTMPSQPVDGSFANYPPRLARRSV
jgi:hypothetical protein